MAVNKVNYGNTTLIDLTDTTATADTILNGYKAYGRDGVAVNGTVAFQTIYTGSTDPSSSVGVNGDIYLKVVS